MPRKSTKAAPSNSPEKTPASSRRNTRRGQKVTEEAEPEVVDEIPAHLLRASDESSEHSDNDSDYGSPKKGRGRGRGRAKKVKEPIPEEKPVSRPRRGRKATAQSPAAAEEQNSQEESVHSQTTNDEHDSQASTMESEQAVEKEKSTEPVEIASEPVNEPQADPVEGEKPSEQPPVVEREASPQKEPEEPQQSIETNTEVVEPEPQQDVESAQTASTEKVSEVTEIEQDLQSSNDNAPVNEINEDVVHDEKDTKSHKETVEKADEEASRDNNEDEGEIVSIDINERHDADSGDDEVSKDAPELPMDDDSRSNLSEQQKVDGENDQQNDEMRRSRSSSGEIHDDSVDQMEVDSPLEILNKNMESQSPVKTAIKVDRKTPPKSTEEKPQTQRKRKWGARKTDDEPVIAITTDSLKNVIAEEVKPVDVKLASSPSPEPEEKRQRVKLTSEDRDIKKKLLKERLRKQEEEEDRRNEQISKSQERSDISPNKIIVTNGAGKDRKVSVVNADEVNASPPTPPKNQTSRIICITNLVRPLTFLAVKSLVSRTGEIEDFWIDQIKSKCFVVYKTEDEAVETRHALHGVKWPEHNLKTLNVEFSTQEEMDKVTEATRGERITSEGTSRESKPEKGFGWSKQEASADDRSKGRRVREWDVGKKDDEDRENRRHRRSPEQRDKSKKRSVSKSPVRADPKEATPVPQQRLLDDLFRKTKAPPFIYWMPLSEERIKELEEQRQKNIAEHNRRMEEMMKIQKERREAREQRMREEEKRREERRERDRNRNRSRSRDSRNRRRSRDRSSRDRDRNRRR